MKKILIAILLAISISVSSFARVESKLPFSLPNDLCSNLKKVEWSTDKDYIKATFVSNNAKTEVLYSKSGEFIGTNYAIKVEELPVNAKRALAKKYSGFTLKDATRFEGAQEKFHYIRAENKNGSVILKVEESGVITTVGK